MPVQLVLGIVKKIGENGENDVRMLTAGAGTGYEPKGRVIALKRKHRNSQINELNCHCQGDV